MSAKRGVTRFEDLIAWQKARLLTGNVYSATDLGGLVRDSSLRNQMRRAATSIMANIAEGFERGGRKEVHRFLCIAKGSCAELRSHLYVAADAGHVSQERVSQLMKAAEEVGRLLGGPRAALERRRLSTQNLPPKPPPSGITTPRASRHRGYP